jgi:hypothetical protein
MERFATDVMSVGFSGTFADCKAQVCAITRVIGNREDLVKLSDGYEHCASRSYADQLER